MKKIKVLVLLVVFCVFSCEKEEGSIESGGNDKLIGTWGDTKWVKVSDNSIDEESDPYDVENQITYHQDGTMTHISDLGTLNGTWENSGGSTYKFTFLSISNEVKIEFLGNDEKRYKDEVIVLGGGEDSTYEVYDYSIRIGDEIPLPTVSTAEIKDIKNNKAISGGNVSLIAGTSVTKRGVCWSTSASPTIEDNKTECGKSYGMFSCEIKNLEANTKYYVRAYATNKTGTSYGKEISFTTFDGIASIVTKPITNIRALEAAGGGEIVNDGGGEIIQSGICWSTSQEPTIMNEKSNDGRKIGDFDSELKSLLPNTTYFVRAYASNEISTSYGNEVSFTTQDGIPIIEDFSINVYKPGNYPYYADIKGNVVSNGGANLTKFGICWSTSQNPTINDNYIGDTRDYNYYNIYSFLGWFSYKINYLETGNTYYVRTYTTNEVGAFYGEEISYTIEPSIKQRLENGETPFQIYNSDNSLLEELYGHNYQGGIIVYMDTTDGSGLIAAPYDQHNSADWGTPIGGYQAIGASGEAIGTGQSNTNIMLDSNPICYEVCPSKLCDDLVIGGYSDWFLPSKEEIKYFMNANKAVDSNSWYHFPNNPDIGYWTSTEGGDFEALSFYRLDFNNFIWKYEDKGKLNRVRAFRYF